MKEQAGKLSVDLSDSRLVALEKYLAEVQRYNEHTNIVANADADVLVRNHVLDSLSLLPIIGKVKSGSGQLRLVDIGSGAGFPAIVLAIALDNVSVLLIDSVGKKTKFLLEAAQSLGLGNQVEVETARAEDLSRLHNYREKFDLATARAVGKLDLVAELTIPFLKVGGWLLAQKSEAQVGEELEPARRVIHTLGAGITSVEKLDSSILERDLVVVCARKDKPTPPKYPRPTAQLKRPIT